MEARLSADAGNGLSYGADGGLYGTTSGGALTCTAMQDCMPGVYGPSLVWNTSGGRRLDVRISGEAGNQASFAADGSLQVGATVPAPPAWTTLPAGQFANGWASPSGVTPAVQYRKQSNGLVQLQGIAGTPTLGGSPPPAGQLMFTLPAGFRPTSGAPLLFAITGVEADVASYAMVQVAANGQVTHVEMAGSIAYLDMSQIWFDAI
ncbi:hypothetical protein ACQEVF_57405 [Nonomuraea polychroma]|uniref:hypothetical protein n=1 Tax=Nonomuraea polychroma TaxID=46176 RepID=UPI003D92A5C8